jgi:hypothetical protein
MKDFGGKVLRAIERDEPLMVQNAQRLQQVLLLKVRKDLDKDRGEMLGRDGIEEVADLIVTRYLLHAEEGLSIIVSLTLFEPALVLQKRRRLREKNAKGASGGIWYLVTGMGAGFTKVG